MENKNIKDFKIRKLCTLRDTRRKKKNAEKKRLQKPGDQSSNK